MMRSFLGWDCTCIGQPLLREENAWTGYNYGTIKHLGHRLREGCVEAAEDVRVCAGGPVRN